MFFKKTPVEKTGLEKAIDEILSQMENCLTVDSEEYSDMSAQLEKLYRLKVIDDDINACSKVNVDTLIKTGGMLAGITIIVLYEQKNVFGSKAMSIVQKLL